MGYISISFKAKWKMSVLVVGNHNKATKIPTKQNKNPQNKQINPALFKTKTRCEITAAGKAFTGFTGFDYIPAQINTIWLLKCLVCQCCSKIHMVQLCSVCKRSYLYGRELSWKNGILKLFAVPLRSSSYFLTLIVQFTYVISLPVVPYTTSTWVDELQRTSKKHTSQPSRPHTSGHTLLSVQLAIFVFFLFP